MPLGFSQLCGVQGGKTHWLPQAEKPEFWNLLGWKQTAPAGSKSRSLASGPEKSSS